MNLLGREIGLDHPLFLISGPCVVENEELQLRTAETLKRIADKLGILFIFKSSFDKANRSSDKSFRGLGMDEGLRILAMVRDEIGVPILTDVHDIPQIAPGVAGLFMETHPDPANAKSDGPNAWPLDRMESLLTTLVELDRIVKARGFEEAAL